MSVASILTSKLLATPWCYFYSLAPKYNCQLRSFLGKIRDNLEQHISNACYKLSQEANRVEKIVNANESLVLSNFLLYMGGAILAGILIGIFITLKYLR